MLIRFFDQAEVDNCKISAQVAAFLARLDKLFTDQFVWTAPGYTSTTLKFLSTVTHFQVNGMVRSLGGPGQVPDDVKSRCLSRMQAWAKLAAEVVRAEHPDFEVVQCFSVFSLKDFPKMTSESIRQDGLPTVFDDAFHRLAGVFGVNATELKQEFFDIGSIALARFHDAGCANVEAWAWAMDATSASVASRRKHPVGNLELVVSEYACMSASDSVIERDFSRIKAILREQQLNGSEAWESDYIIIAQSDSEFDKDVVGLAKQVWQELYAPCRKRMKPRFDKGTVKTKVPEKDDTLSPEKLTHGQFKKKRRMALPAGQAEDAVAACASSAWTEDHDKELAFNAKKQLVRVFESAPCPS